MALESRNPKAMEAELDPDGCNSDTQKDKHVFINFIRVIISLYTLYHLVFLYH